jgi:hypothetical protein
MLHEPVIVPPQPCGNKITHKQTNPEKKRKKRKREDG